MINRIGFLLVKPQLPENIGFCARALKNFGFKKLDLVDPKEKWPNKHMTKKHLIMWWIPIFLIVIANCILAAKYLV